MATNPIRLFAKSILICVMFTGIVISGCSSDNVIDEGTLNDSTYTPNPDYTVGKNRYTSELHGDKREYYVHVPATYDSTQPVPVVFMLHGTSGDGEKFYNISGWKELGERENIITVYPSSWRYCIIDDGVKKTTTKWNIFPGSFEYCSGEMPRDDVGFLRQVIQELKERFTIDEKRIYLAGFSNGGAMAARCAVEMSDVFAAIVEAAGSFPSDTTALPNRKLPVTFMVGNSDNKWLPDGTTNFPMKSFDALMTEYRPFRHLIRSHVRTFGLDTNHTTSGDTNSVLVATYEANPVTPELHFQFVLINNLGHRYPNGTNHPITGATVNWNWMKEFRLP